MKPLQIFISYAHQDENILKRLSQHLASLRRQGIISLWHDKCLRPGDEWEEKIDQNLESADIILFIISSAFISSDYCWGIEMKRAIEKHQKKESHVIPIIARPVDFTGAPFSKLESLPTGNKAITEWPNKDAAFTNIASGIRKVATN